MDSGYHLRFLKVTNAARSIEEADVVRVPPFKRGAYSFGVQLHARPSTDAEPDENIVAHLTRHEGESEDDFVKRAFGEAAARQQELQ